MGSGRACDVVVLVFFFGRGFDLFFGALEASAGLDFREVGERAVFIAVVGDPVPLADEFLRCF